MTKKIISQYFIGELSYQVTEGVKEASGWRGYSLWRNGGMIGDGYFSLRTTEVAMVEDAKSITMEQLGDAVAIVARTHTLLMELGDIKWPRGVAAKYGVKKKTPNGPSRGRSGD